VSCHLFTGSAASVLGAITATMLLVWQIRRTFYATRTISHGTVGPGPYAGVSHDVSRREGNCRIQLPAASFVNTPTRGTGLSAVCRCRWWRGSHIRIRAFHSNACTYAATVCRTLLPLPC